MSNGTPLSIGQFAKLAGPVIANLPREMDSQLALDFAGNGDALEIVLVEALTRANLDRALVALGKKQEPQPIPPILRFIDTVTFAARTTRFVPKNVFTTKNARVRFGYVDPDFTSWFGNKAEEPTAETKLRRYVLARPSVFAPAMKEARDGGVATKTTPGELYSMLEQQPNGEAGSLLVNGYANLFEMDDVNDVARLVGALWFGDLGWRVCARGASYSLQWRGGVQLFSRDSR